MRKMIRRIAKNVVSDDSFSSIQEFERSLYILENLKDSYLLPLQIDGDAPGD